MAEQPALNRSYVISYAANDRNFAVVGIRLDPRVAGYRVPEDLSPHPDSKRYPNHVFTGSQPSNGDERVTHIYEILPSPYAPFTRYDDDLGPIQGRRRSVKNEGQIARLGPDQRVNYEAREGSAIVYTEIEESWSVATDDDGNSLFPIRDRDFYDASRGAVQERRQLIVTTGEEVGTLENINGVITQTSYEAYNEYLSVKTVQTYSVSGPQLAGQATDNDGQLVTVLTQRKAADGYVPPLPTATRTVEVSREDAESLIERVVNTPQVFDAKSFSIERTDPTPQKFRVLVPTESEQETLVGTAGMPSLVGNGELSKSEQQLTKFVKRISQSSRDQTQLPQFLTQKSTNNDGQVVTVTETLQDGDTEEEPDATTTIQSEALGDGNYVVTKTEVPEVFDSKSFSIERPDPAPQKFRIEIPTVTEQETIEGEAETPELQPDQLSKSEQQVTKFVKRLSTTSRDVAENSTLIGEALTQDLNGGIAQVIETYADESEDINVEFGTVSAEKETLGANKVLIRKVVLEPEVRTGQIYDDTLDISYPFEREIIQAGQTAEGSEIQPRDHLHSVKTTVDKNAARTELLATSFTLPEMVNISLPDRLTGVSLNVYYTPIGVANAGTGNTKTITVSAQVSTDSILNYNIKQGYNGPIQATKHIFFLENNATIESIESKLSADRWPTIITEPARIEIIEYTEKADSQGSSSLPLNVSYQTNKNVFTSAKIVEIPPTVHGSISINAVSSGTSTETESGFLAVSNGVTSTSVTIVASATGSVRFTPSISATSPYTRFPSGRYIYSMNCSPYKYGLMRVDAITVDITDDIT